MYDQKHKIKISRQLALDERFRLHVKKFEPEHNLEEGAKQIDTTQPEVFALNEISITRGDYSGVAAYDVFVNDV